MLSSGVLVKVLMSGVLLLVANIPVFAWRTAGTLVDGDAWKPCDAVVVPLKSRGLVAARGPGGLS